VRKLLLGAIAGAVLLAVAAIAMAETTTTFSQKYITKAGATSKKPGASVGTSFATTSTESDNEDKNHQPKSTREFDIKFPTGTQINYKAAPVCKNLEEGSDKPCPDNTKIGSGHAQVLLPFQGTEPIDATVTAYNRVKGLWLYVVPSIQGQAPVVLKPHYDGLTLKTATPPNCIVSSNQNGHCVNNDGSEGSEAVLTEFDLKTKPIKKGKKIYLRAPKTCPKGGWIFKAHITYDDGSSVSPRSSSPCKK
jgi:hypothetical protein